jgi:hypothetical protein
MKRRLFVCVAGLVVLCGMWTAFAAENPFYINRARIILDLIRDAEVTTPANYTDDKIDYIDGATAVKYVEAVIMVHGNVTQKMIDGDAEADPPVPAMTSETKARIYLDCLKKYHRHAYRTVQVPANVQAYRATQDETVETEGRTDLGEDEFSEEE